jgi:PAS domain S-box-containing protein
MDDAREPQDGSTRGDFRLLFAGNPLPMWLYDLETLAFLDVNDAAVAHYGYSRAEFLQMRITDIRPEEDIERLLADVRSLRPSLQSSGEWRHRLRDGRVIDVEIASHTLEFRGGLAALVVVHDVTDRKQAELALKRSEGRKAAILESALDCIVTIDEDGRVVDFNPAAERTFGYRYAEVVGRPLVELIIPPDLRQAHRDGLARYRATGEHAVLGRRIEMRAMRADGSEFPVELAITPFRERGEAMFTGYLRDISERKRAEEEIRQLNVELEARVAERTIRLEAANRELDAFSYSVSHDLRAPLRSVDGFSKALLDDYADNLDPKARNYLQRVRAAAQRMGELIDDLLDLSRLGRAELSRNSVSLSEIAQIVAMELRKRDPDRQVEVDIQDGLVVDGDRRLLRIALENLLGNAWKFTAKVAQARIQFGGEHTGGGTVYFVRDNGAGFDMTYVAKLFQPFQRLHGNADFPGTGIGLATVHRIVDRHGGRAWAEGTVGTGATVYFTLPPMRPGGRA